MEGKSLFIEIIFKGALCRTPTVLINQNSRLTFCTEYKLKKKIEYPLKLNLATQNKLISTAGNRRVWCLQYFLQHLKNPHTMFCKVVLPALRYQSMQLQTFA